MYSADQATTRGGLKEINYSAWYRNFRFEIAVRCPDFWASPEVCEELSRTLNELSGDTFEFVFSRLYNPPPIDDYFDFGADTGVQVDEVMLFSGGLDSFGGAVEEIFTRGRKVALVSHRPNGKLTRAEGTRQGYLLQTPGSSYGSDPCPDPCQQSQGSWKRLHAKNTIIPVCNVGGSRGEAVWPGWHPFLRKWCNESESAHQSQVASTGQLAPRIRWCWRGLKTIQHGVSR